MKHLRSIFLGGCVFTTVITLLFSVVAFIINRAEGIYGRVSLPVSQFLLILLFSFVIASANHVFFLRRLHTALRLLIHYAALLVSFIFIFVVAGNLHITGPASVFISIFVFTVLYAILMAIVISLLRAVGYLDKTLGYAHKVRDAEQYTKRFK